MRQLLFCFKQKATYEFRVGDGSQTCARQVVASSWSRVLPQVSSAPRGGARIVMTSPDYIYNRARRDLKQNAFPLLCGSQVVIDVRDISTDEKRQILYNHMKLGRQPKEFTTAIKGLLQGVGDHETFITGVGRT